MGESYIKLHTNRTGKDKRKRYGRRLAEVKPQSRRQKPMEQQVVLKIVRVGECKQCGWCCGFVDGKITEGACSHLTSDGKCSIHDRLEEFCPEHGRTHEDCIRNPEFPLRKQNPKCGYRFCVEGSNAEVINVELADWEFLSRYG